MRPAASRRVDEEKVERRQAVEGRYGVGFLHFGMGRPHQRQVVAGQPAEHGLLFHVNGPAEQGGEKGEVHAQSARQVGHAVTVADEALHQPHLVVNVRAPRQLQGQPGDIVAPVRFDEAACGFVEFLHA